MANDWVVGQYVFNNLSCVLLFIVSGERLISGMIDKLMDCISNMIVHIDMHDNLLVQIHYVSVLPHDSGCLLE